jgi:hypothetical protein
VESRPRHHYKITEDELAWLGEHVAALGVIVELICREQISALKRSAAA